MSTDGNYPRIVIVGRPNVGKSTLFNRLYGRRRAITDPTAGVTRDVIEERCVLARIPVFLVDTGGIKTEFLEDFDKEVAYRAISSINNADVILFLVELGELTAEDYLIAEKVRSRANKVILVVNKVDAKQKECQASEYYSMGFGEPLAVSAEHGRNVDSLLGRISQKLRSVCPKNLGTGDAKEEKAGILGRGLERDPLVVTLVGKPNTGKSTLFNRLLDGEYSLVSKLAGTTRDTVVSTLEYRGRCLRLIDTAGMRRKSRIAGNVEYYSVNRAIVAMFSTDVTVLLIDSEEGLSEQDKKIADQAVKKGCAVVMAMNKWDERVVDRARLKKTLDRIHFKFPVLNWAPIVPISALKGYGIDKLLSTVIKVDKQQRRRVETSKLNRALGEWLNLKPVPTGAGRPYRVKYITQVSVRPARFIGFVNRRNGFPGAYRQFLVNQIRRVFGFDLVSVELELREGKR